MEFIDHVEGQRSLMGVVVESAEVLHEVEGTLTRAGRRQESLSTYGGDELATYADDGTTTYDEEY